MGESYQIVFLFKNVVKHSSKHFQAMSFVTSRKLDHIWYHIISPCVLCDMDSPSPGQPRVPCPLLSTICVFFAAKGLRERKGGPRGPRGLRGQRGWSARCDFLTPSQKDPFRRCLGRWSPEWAGQPVGVFGMCSPCSWILELDCCWATKVSLNLSQWRFFLSQLENFQLGAP